MAVLARQQDEDDEDETVVDPNEDLVNLPDVARWPRTEYAIDMARFFHDAALSVTKGITVTDIFQRHFPGQTYSRTDSGVPGAGNDIVTTVTGKTVYVDVK